MRRVCAGLFPGVAADIIQTAFFAFRLAGIAHSAAVHHKAVAQVAALFRRNDFPQGHFHLLRLLDAVHKADLVAQTDAVGVGDNGRFAEHIAHDQVAQKDCWTFKTSEP